MKCNMEINWALNTFCNFDCTYCHSKSTSKFVGLEDTQKVVDGFNRGGFNWLIYMSGGEPFFYPNFVELCEKLTQRHIISINTNGSHKDIFRFGETINPERVRCVHFSLHIQELERLNLIKDFIKKYKFLERKGFYVYSSYVMYPPLINRFKENYDYFKSEGIILRPKVFRGMHNRFKMPDLRIFKKINNHFNQVYPEAYSKKEKKMIISYIEQSQKDGNFIIDHTEDTWKGRISDVYLDKYLIDGLPSFKGKYCMTGKSFVRMNAKGELHRCHNDSRYLGNLFEGRMRLFDKPMKCASDVCSCPYIGYRHVLKTEKE